MKIPLLKDLHADPLALELSAKSIFEKSLDQQ